MRNFQVLPITDKPSAKLPAAKGVRLPSPRLMYPRSALGQQDFRKEFLSAVAQTETCLARNTSAQSFAAVAKPVHAAARLSLRLEFIRARFSPRLTSMPQSFRITERRCRLVVRRSVRCFGGRGRSEQTTTSEQSAAAPLLPLTTHSQTRTLTQITPQPPNHTFTTTTNMVKVSYTPSRLAIFTSQSRR